MEVHYFIKEKHFTRSIEVLSEWEKDYFTFELANAFKSVIKALMKTGEKIKINEQKIPLGACPCGFVVNSNP